MERFRDRALVLGHVDYGDADRIVTLLTRDHGKVTAFAAGARKSKRRFAGALEPMTELDVALVERRGSTLRLDAADIRRSFDGVRRELSLIARALYAIELVRELTRDHEPHPDLLDLSLGFLDHLEHGEADATSLLSFELSALACAGLMPRFDACALCGRQLLGALRFDAEHGGVVCAACSPRAQRGAPVSADLVAALRALQQGEAITLSADQRRRARGLLEGFIAHQLGRRLKGAEFMNQVGLD